jgi:excisionase family DNA binding protein
MKGEMLTVNQAAEYCGVSPMTVRRWIDTGTIPYFQIMPHAPIKIRKAVLDDMFQEKRKTPKQESPD